jgi:hypothetical protein
VDIVVTNVFEVELESLVSRKENLQLAVTELTTTVNT